MNKINKILFYLYLCISYSICIVYLILIQIKQEIILLIFTNAVISLVTYTEYVKLDISISDLIKMIKGNKK